MLDPGGDHPITGIFRRQPYMVFQSKLYFS
jgi:hypothetical protein